MGMAEDMQMLQYLQQSAGHGQIPQQGMQQQPMGGMPEQQQMQQEMQPQQPQRPNPLQAGSMAAIEAAKRSLEMSENENRRALGRAMIGMMSGISQAPSYGQGLAGNIGALTAGFAPALSAYDAERDRIAQINHALQVQQKQEEMLARKEEREMKRMAHEMDLEGRKVKVAEGYLGLERQKNEDEKREHETLSGTGGSIPLSSIKRQSGWNYVQAYLDKKAERGEAAAENIRSINEIKQILKDDSDITKDWSTIMLAAQRKDPTIVRQKLNSWFIPEERRVRAELLAKNLANLATGKIKGSAARAMNQMYERWLKEGTADINMLSDSMGKILDRQEEQENKIYEDWVDSYNEYQRGFFKRSAPIELKNLSEEEVDELYSTKDTKKSADKITKPETMTEQQKQARIQELLKMRETAPE